MNPIRRRRLGGGAFDPRQLPGLKLWLKADAITGLSDGTAVSTWLDSSGLGNSLSQGTGANQPTYKINIVNGKPVVRFDGVNGKMTGANVVSGTIGRTVFLVAKTVTTANKSIFNLADKTAPANGADFIMTPEIAVRINGGNRVFSSSMGTTAFRVVSIAAAAGSDVSATSVWLDGVALGQTSASALAINTGTDPTAIGNSLNGAPWDGDIAEFLVYAVQLGAGDQKKVERYLGAKYGITVS